MNTRELTLKYRANMYKNPTMFSKEWLLDCGIVTIPVGCSDKFLTKTERQDRKELKHSQQKWWEFEDRGGYRVSVFDGSTLDDDYPHDEYDYSSDDQDNFEYQQDQYL